MNTRKTHIGRRIDQKTLAVLVDINILIVNAEIIRQAMRNKNYFLFLFLIGPAAMIAAQQAVKLTNIKEN